MNSKIWILLMSLMLFGCDANKALTPQQIAAKVKECKQYGLAAHVSVWTNFEGEGAHGYPQVIACVPEDAAADKEGP